MSERCLNQGQDRTDDPHSGIRLWNYPDLDEAELGIDRMDALGDSTKEDAVGLTPDQFRHSWAGPSFRFPLECVTQGW